MKIYIIRETVDGSVFTRNHYRWYEGNGNPFEESFAQDSNWHIFNKNDLASTNSNTVWGRYRRCIGPFFMKVIYNLRIHGSINTPTASPGSWGFIQETPLLKQIIATIKREWPDVLNNLAIPYISTEHTNYIHVVVAGNLEIVESEFGVNTIKSLPFIDYSTKALQRAYKKIEMKRAAGQPVY